MAMKSKKQPVGEIDLDLLFRKDSKARMVAEDLLRGGAVYRHDLSQTYSVSVTTVNRVVEALEGAGATIHRDLDGRRATFEVTSIGPKKPAKQYPSLGSTAKIVGATALGDDVQVDFLAEDQRYRGTVLHLLKGGAPVGLQATVVSVNLESNRTASVTLDLGDETQMRLGNCIAVVV